MKCDRLHPCSNCAKYKRECAFLAPASRVKLTELKEKMGQLEQSLARDAAEQCRTGNCDEEYPASGADSNFSPEAPYDEKDLRQTELADEDAAYEDEADDDAYDVGFMVGKMRMTDRLGGLFRPRLVEEVCCIQGRVVLELSVLTDCKQLSSTLRSLSISERDEPKMPPENSSNVQETLPGSVFSPGPSYISPRSDLFFSKARCPNTLVDFLPSRVAADRLLKQYWEAVHPIAKVLHRPTFEKQYAEFWSDISKDLAPVPSLQALVFAVLFAASTSISEHVALGTFGIPQKKLIENFQVATEMGLGKANFLRTSKLQTLQAFVMYMV